MKIENLTLKFHPQCQFDKLILTDLQKQYLTELQMNQSLYDITMKYLNMGWLLNFIEMYRLVELLSQNGWILNTEFKDYFRKEKMNTLLRDDFAVSNSKTQLVRLDQFPFFRSLPKELIQYFEKIAISKDYQSGQAICRAGDIDRDLCLIVSGEAAIYKPENNHLNFVALIHQGSLFGEMAFFLGSPRSATVVAQKKSQILRIPYQSEVLDKHLNLEKNKSLIHRFWLQQALQNSDFFKKIPSDCLDALLFQGHVVKIKQGNYLFQQGDVSKHFYILLQGHLDVFQNNKKINQLMQGQVIGEVSLLMNQGHRTASLQAVKESLLLEIPSIDFYKLLGSNLALGKEFQILAQERVIKDQMRNQKMN